MKQPRIYVDVYILCFKCAMKSTHKIIQKYIEIFRALVIYIYTYPSKILGLVNQSPDSRRVIKAMTRSSFDPFRGDTGCTSTLPLFVSVSAAVSDSEQSCRHRNQTTNHLSTQLSLFNSCRWRQELSTITEAYSHDRNLRLTADKR